jgi:hypothetical protein
MVMDLDIFEAFRAAGVPDDKARGAIDAIHGLIDRRYALHAEQLATRTDMAEMRGDLQRDVERLRGDLERAKGELAAKIAGTMTAVADAKSELIRWSVGSIFSAVAMVAAITRLLSH